MTVWTWLWLAWVAAFGVIEGIALANSTPSDTLSEHVWRWITQPESRVKSTRKKWVVWLGRAATGGFLVWLLLHMTLGV